MKNIYPIFKKEVSSYFGSPTAYIVITIFLLISGYFFYSGFAFFSLISFRSMGNPAILQQLNINEGVVKPLYGNISIILLLIIPLLTMRLFAEEKKSGTIELLLTYPVKDSEAILGKFFACAFLLFFMLLLTGFYPLLLILFAKPEIEPILSIYLGLFLMGISFIALGTFASSLTENQIVAASITFGTLLFFFVIGWASSLVGSTFGKVLEHLSIMEHFSNFAKGIIETKDIIYYVNFTIFFLFLTSSSLESKKWRG